MLALARKLVSGEADAESVESVFAQAQRVAADAEALLVDDGWQRSELDTEPLVVTFPRNSHAEPMVELVPCGGHYGSPEAQPSLFSWAEFMAEPTEQPKRRGRKIQPDSRAVRVGVGTGARGRAGRRCRIGGHADGGHHQE